MKRVLLTAVIICSFGMITMCANAQDSNSVGGKIKKVAKKTGKTIAKGAKKVGNKTAEFASKGSSAVIDKKYEGKTGPEGQRIYINDKSEYYWVDEKGSRHYIKESDLKDKKD